MPWLPLPSFHRIDENAFQEAARKSKSTRWIKEDAYQEAIRKTKSIRRSIKRDDLRKELGGGKERGKAAGMEEVQEVHSLEGHAHEKMQRRSTLPKDMGVRDIRTQEIRPGKRPRQQTHARGDHERDLQELERRGHDAVNRRRPEQPSRTADLGTIVNDRKVEDHLDYRPHPELRSSRRPNRKNLPNRFSRPSREPTRTSGTYKNIPKVEEMDDSGYQLQSGATSSQGLAVSDDNEEEPEVGLLRLRRLSLLSPLENPLPRKRELREPDLKGDADFTRRHDERRFHVPGTFDDDNDTEDEEFFDTQSRLGPDSSRRRNSTVYGENDAEAHLSRLRRLEALRHSYDQPVSPCLGSHNMRYPAQQENRREFPYGHVHIHELDGREIRNQYVSNHRGGLDPQNQGDNYKDDDELIYSPHDETRQSRRHIHHDAANLSYGRPDSRDHRPENTRRLASKSQPDNVHSTTSRREEPSRRRHHDGRTSEHSRPTNQGQRSDNSRRLVPQPQPAKAQPRRYSIQSRQEDPPHRIHHGRPNLSYVPPDSQGQRLGDRRRSSSKSRPTKADSVQSRQGEPPRRTRDGPSHLSSQRRNQSQRLVDSRRSIPQSQSVRTHQELHQRHSHREEPPRRNYRDIPPRSHSQFMSHSQRPTESRRPVPQSQSVRTHITPHRTQSHGEEPPRQSSS